MDRELIRATEAFSPRQGLDTQLSMNQNSEIAAKLKLFFDLLWTSSTGSWGSETTDKEYRELREFLIAQPVLTNKLPAWVRANRQQTQFWSFIKGKFRTYQDRRDFLTTEFVAAFEAVEGQGGPADALVTLSLSNLNQLHVHNEWQKALLRRESDPAGAITTARTLLESVCKCILEDFGEVPLDDELPKLYKQTAKRLNLSPDQHTEQIFKQILGGCISVVEGLGALRNKVGDAHGHSGSSVRPAPRHAEMAVNLSGSVASFLVATWLAKKVAKGS